MTSTRQEKIAIANKLVMELREEMAAYNKILKEQQDLELDIYELEQDPKNHDTNELKKLRSRYELFFQAETKQKPITMLEKIEQKIQALYEIDKEIYGPSVPPPSSPSFMRLRD